MAKPMAANSHTRTPVISAGSAAFTSAVLKPLRTAGPEAKTTNSSVQRNGTMIRNGARRMGPVSSLRASPAYFIAKPRSGAAVKAPTYHRADFPAVRSGRRMARLAAGDEQR